MNILTETKGIYRNGDCKVKYDPFSKQSNIFFCLKYVEIWNRTQTLKGTIPFKDLNGESPYPLLRDQESETALLSGIQTKQMRIRGWKGYIVFNVYIHASVSFEDNVDALIHMNI